MPSLQHEAPLYLFRNRPSLAPELLRDVLAVDVPAYTNIRLESGDFTEIAPTQYLADLVVLLTDDTPVLAIVIEVQLRADPLKQLTWPSYLTLARKRFACPACVLVFTLDEQVADWCRTPFSLGPGNLFAPLVVGPQSVPKITDVAIATRDPELALLSVMAHGTSDDARAVGLAALAAVAGLPDERQVVYSDLVLASVGAATRVALEELMASGNYVFQSDFAKKHQAIGREEGLLTAGRESLLTLIEARGLPLTEQQRATIATCSDHALLDAWFLRAVTATAPDAIFDA